MEKFSSEDRNPQCNTERERNEQCRGDIRIAQPPHLMEPLKYIGHEPAEIVGNHNNRQTFDRVLEDGLALRRLVDAHQERQVLRLQHEIDAGTNNRDRPFKPATKGVHPLQELLIALRHSSDPAENILGHRAVVWECSFVE